MTDNRPTHTDVVTISVNTCRCEFEKKWVKKVQFDVELINPNRKLPLLRQKIVIFEKQ